MFVIGMLVLIIAVYSYVPRLLKLNGRNAGLEVMQIGKLCLIVAVLLSLFNGLGLGNTPSSSAACFFVLLSVGAGILLRTDRIVMSYWAKSRGEHYYPNISQIERYKEVELGGVVDEWVYVCEDRNLLMQLSDWTLKEMANELDLTEEQKLRLTEFCYEPWNNYKAIKK